MTSLFMKHGSELGFIWLGPFSSTETNTEQYGAAEAGSCDTGPRAGLTNNRRINLLHDMDMFVFNMDSYWIFSNVSGIQQFGFALTECKSLF